MTATPLLTVADTKMGGYLTVSSPSKARPI
jgi:hypothetical protein